MQTETRNTDQDQEHVTDNNSNDQEIQKEENLNKMNHDAESIRRLKDLESENADLKKQVLLQMAENDNLRKRFARELDDAKRYSIGNFANDLIEVLENLYRATENIVNYAEMPQEMQSITEGIIMTQKLLLSAFEKHGLKRISPNVGDEFDHRYHQALSQVAEHNHPQNTIAQVVQAGYMIDTRLLRPALVIVNS